ncbi:hypothetical protein FHE66_04625 [Georgenia sp. 311]|uniref:carboxypeptidase regulatory-like domain-containing protein n=1 Tax=Georgenia sp. 311 TaxID=2585134 RepID=UPI00111266D7|nr:carboxypeptidase regulatory-like domain-containing protein [Georgenia sp. 311]TNC19197.1 hypothetical protein FHE66_04625 [Georgenia sp. 311]
MSTYLPTSAPTVTVVPGAHAPAGQAATVRVHVRNLADGPRDLTVTALGIDWLPAPVRVADVASDATVTVELAVPVGAGAVPGDYPFALAVEAHRPGGRPTARTVTEGSLRVDAPSEVVLSVEPAETRAVRRRTVSVVVANGGDVPVPLEMGGTTERGLSLHLDRRHVTVPAHGTVRVPARLSVRRPRVVGHHNRLAFTVTARGRQAPARVHGTLTSRPLLTSGVLRVFSVVTALAVWAGALGLGVPWVAEQVAGPDQADVVAGGTGDDVGGDGATGTGDGGADDLLDDGAGAPEGVRIGGTVTGSDPAGVRVDIAPASLLDQQTGTVPATTGAPPAGAAGATGGGPLGTSVPLLRAARPPADPAGKVPSGALPVTRTEPLDATRSTSTHEDGTWAFAGLPATQNYLITLSKPGYQTQRFVMSGAEAAAGLEVELVAGAGRLSGTTTGPGGHPVGGVDITITDGTTTITTSTNTTGDVGAWAVEGLSTPSTYLVTASGNGLGTEAALVPLAAAGAERVDLALDTAVSTLTGVVTGPDSLGAVGGLGGITVTATDGTTTRTASTATGDLSGRYVLADLPVPGRYTVTVTGDGYASHTREVELGHGAATTVDVRLGVSSGVVQGTVAAPDGVGLGGAGLTLRGDSGTYKTMSASDARGSFRFNGIAPGDYVLQAELFGHLTGLAPVTVAAGGAASADLVLTPVADEGLLDTARVQGAVSDASTNGQIECPAGTDPEDCVVTVTTRAQTLDGTTRTVTVTVAPDLPYTLPPADQPGLLPGLYQVDVSAPGYEPGRVTVQVPMGETVQANPVALYRSPSVTGVVSTRVGMVPDGTCVLAVPGTGAAADADCTVDSGGVCTVSGATLPAGARCAGLATNGSYTLEQLSSGSWSVAVRPPDGSEYLPVAAVSLVLEPGELRRYDATLNRLGRVDLTVLYDRGGGVLEPAAGAAVTPVRLAGDTPDAVTTGPTGLAGLTHLTPGSYRLEVAYTPPGSGRTYTGATPVLTVGLNQEVTRQLVLTGGTGYAVDGAVFTNLGAGGTPPVAGVSVSVNGITGYAGLVPVRETVTMTTGAAGQFEVVAEDGSPDVPGDPTGRMTFVSDRVSITVEDPLGRYAPLSLTDVAITEPAVTLELEPLGRPVEILVDGVADADRANLALTVTQAPPGAQRARVATNGSGAATTYVWHDDLAQPFAVPGEYGRGTLIRPGLYTITPELGGYETNPVQVLVAPRGEGVTDPVRITVSLAQYGQLVVEVVQTGSCADGGCTRVLDPVVTLMRPQEGDRTARAVVGTNRVNFGPVAPGTYEVYVQAAGHEFTVSTITVAPAQAEPVPVEVRRLGTISGTVRSTGGDSLAGVTVSARPPDGGEPFLATTDTTGSFRITGTDSREGLRESDQPWVLTFAAAGYVSDTGASQPNRVEVLVSEGSSPAPLDVALAPLPVDVYVDVYDPDAAADGLVEGLSVTLLQGSRRYTGADLDSPDGRYYFADVVPGVYTVSVTGGDYAPLVTTITVPASGEATSVSLSIASRRNTVTGTIMGQAGGGAAAPVGGATVTLQSASGDTETVETGSSGAGAGRFTFDGVPDGEYVLTAEHPSFGPAASRSVKVERGQVLTVDIVLYAAARQVEVTVRSVNGFDLTGMLVRLEPPGGPAGSLAPQPVARATDGTYRTVFNQVPPVSGGGPDWEAVASGPVGHLGTHRASISGTTATIDVREVRLRVSATADGPEPPATLGVTVRSTGDTPGTELSVGVGGTQESVYLPAGSRYTVTATAVPGWTLASPTVEVDATGPASEAVAAFRLTSDTPVVLPAVTTTTVAADRATVTTGGSVTLTARVASSPPAAGGTVTFVHNGRALGPVALTSGTATAVVPGLTAGIHEFSATYSGATGFAPSATAASAFVLAADPGTAPSSVALSAAAGAGSVTFTVTPDVPGVVRVVVTGPAGTVLEADASGPVSLTWTAAPGTYSAYAQLFPRDPGRAPSTSSPVPFTVLAEP